MHAVQETFRREVSKGRANRDLTPRSPEQDLYFQDLYFAYHLPTPDRMGRFCLSEPDRHDFFIAYTFKAIAMVRALDEAIRAEGFKSWIGDLEALVSQTYQGNVDRGIRESDGFVLLAGAEGIPLDLQNELEQALKLNKLIFLLAHQPLATEHLNLPPLQGLQWAPLTQIESSYGFKGIARLLVHSLTYVRLLARALEWERQSYPNDRLLSLGDLATTQKRLGWIHQHLGSDFEQQPVQRQFLAASAEHIKTGRRTDYFQGNPPDVFISYSSQDRDFVKQLSDSLKDSKLGIWVDWENIPIATNWRDEVMAGIQAAHTLLFVISPHSVRSEHCRWQLEQARHCGRRIIPIVCNTSYDPYRLEAIDLAELSYVSFEELPFQDAAAKVVTAIRTDLTDVKAYNRLYSKAYEWHIHQRDDSLLMDAKDFRRVQSWLRDRQSVEKKADGKTQLVPLHPLQTAYIDASAQAMRAERQQRWLLVGFTAAGFMAALTIAAFARLGEVKALTASVEGKSGLDALITALRTSKRLEDNFYLPWLQPDLSLDVATVLTRSIYNTKEINILNTQAEVFDLDFNFQKQQLASASEDRTVSNWNLYGLQNILSNFQSDPTSLDYSPDGDSLAIGFQDGTIELFEVQPNRLESSIENRTSNNQSFSNILNPAKEITEIKTLEKQEGTISQVLFSQGGKYLATASNDSTVFVWSKDNGFGQPTILNSDGPVSSISFTDRSRKIAAGDRTTRGNIYLWDISGNLIKQFEHGHPVISISCTTDGKLCASSGFSNVIKLWNLSNGTSQSLIGHQDIVNHVKFSRDGYSLISASKDFTARIWSVPDGKLLHTLRGHQGSVERAEFYPERNIVVTSSADSTLKVWSSSLGRLLYTFIGHGEPILDFVFADFNSFNPITSQNENSNLALASLVASVSSDKTIRLWTLDSLVNVLPHPNQIYDLAFRPDGQMIATAGLGEISFWRAGFSESTLVSEIIYSDGTVSSIDYSPSGQLLAAGDSKGDVKIWKPEVSLKTPITEIESPTDAIDSLPGFIPIVKFSPDGRLLAFTNNENELIFWDIVTEKAIKTIEMNGRIKSLDFDSTGDQLVVSIQDMENPSIKSQINIFGMKDKGRNSISLEKIASIDVSEQISGNISTVLFNPLNHDEIAVGGDDGSIQLVSTNGKLLKSFVGSASFVTSLSFHPSEPILSSSHADGSILIWRTSSRSGLITSLKPSSTTISALEFSPNASSLSVLASAGFDKNLRFWALPSNLYQDPLGKMIQVGCNLSYVYLNQQIPDESLPSESQNSEINLNRNFQEVQRFCNEK
jgi:WD40 repeat protein